MRDIVLATLCGLGVGVGFAFFKLPVPAPPTAAGVAGIAGITIGWAIVRHLTGP